ncbi:uncharacterized protein LOC123529978 [Mercenaria mercenaria]|uniref:uncharacterized protein LOC123529978 n=1 Tax=Mercenaria mercenaria TaxID=6596 RepID=UPI00234E45BD|nr:uncharacterized protein LOC123529978 [Mercenaria mercenaria]
MATKLRSIQKGHKGAVTRLLSKFEMIQQEAAGLEELQTIEDSLRQKQQTITEIHEKIIDVIPEDDGEQIETEILDHNEYIYNLQTKIQKVASFKKVTFSNLNVNSQAFLVSERGEAGQTIADFALTNANYDKAVLLLHERYGQKDRIIQTYMKALLEVPAPVNTVTSLRKFYDTTETYIRGLDSLNQCESKYGSLLTPIILQKLPPEVRTNITRAHGTLSWCLNELMKCLINEINIMDAGSALNTGQEFILTAIFLTKSDTRKTERRNIHRPTRPSVKPKSVQVPTCVYCKGEHSSTNCVKIKDREQRLNIVKEKQLCFNCLRTHKVSECRSKFNCMICSRRHHTSICEEESRKRSTDEPPKTHDAKETQSSVLHLAHNFALGPVLLKTAVSMVTSSCTSTTANILFDEGSQSSCLAQKLQLQPTGSETLCLSGFGDTERRIRHLDTATVYLQTPEFNIPIKVLIVPEISVPLKTYQKHAGHLPYLKGLKLAHPMSEEDNFEIEILVGADHYWDIVQDTVVRGDGPTAIQSGIGYLLSGPLSTENQIQPSPFPLSMLNVMTMHVQEEVNLERFWEVESLGVEQKSVHQGYEEYIKQYQNTGISYENGKYIAKLPWKENHPILPSNELISRRRTVSVVNRLRKEPELFQKYREILSEQVKRGFIENITDVKSSENTKLHYIPHHPVKKDSATTPIRIVYDCSCKSTRDSPP